MQFLVLYLISAGITQEACDTQCVLSLDDGDSSLPALRHIASIYSRATFPPNFFNYGHIR